MSVELTLNTQLQILNHFFPSGILFKRPQAFLFCFTTFLDPFSGPHSLKYLSLFYHYL